MKVVIVAAFCVIFTNVKVDTEEIVFPTEACRTPNYEEAYCLPIKKCPVFLKALTNLTETRIKFMRESLCRHEKVPIICCGSTADYGGYKWPIPEFNRTLLPIDCGYYFTYAIPFNGAQMTESLHNALLEYKQNENSTGYHCGGSLINSRYVLTAAHCLVGKEKSLFGHVFQVRLGEYLRDNENDCDVLSCNPPDEVNCCTTENYEDLQIEEVIIHENFSVSNPSLNDIALIRLNKSANIGAFIQTICLPRSDNKNDDETYQVTGWAISRNYYGTLNKQLGHVQLNNKKNCGFDFNLTESQICIDKTMLNNSRFTDSGGALYRSGVIKGIDSLRLEEDSGEDGTAVLYTNVYSFMKWITEHMKP